MLRTQNIFQYYHHDGILFQILSGDGIISVTVINPSILTTYVKTIMSDHLRHPIPITSETPCETSEIEHLHQQMKEIDIHDYTFWIDWDHLSLPPLMGIPLTVTDRKYGS